jgi:hypothetical protein
MRALIPLFLLLSGCIDSSVYLKNPRTGEVVKCGSLHGTSYFESNVQANDFHCINDYKEQGYVRIPKP